MNALRKSEKYKIQRIENKSIALIVNVRPKSRGALACCQCEISLGDHPESLKITSQTPVKEPPQLIQETYAKIRTISATKNTIVLV